jgi:hypothetical protein
VYVGTRSGDRGIEIPLERNVAYVPLFETGMSKSICCPEESLKAGIGTVES